MKNHWIAAGAFSAALVAAAGFAQQESQTKKQVGKTSAAKSATSIERPDNGTDGAAIAANVKAFAKRADAQDANAIAALFTETGEFIDGDGNVFHGRTAIEAEFEALFKVNPTGHLEISATTLRAIALGVVVEEGIATIRPADMSSATAVGYTIVHVKQPNGKWLMASVRSKGDEARTPHEQLRQLEWLIGDWVDESDNGVVRTSTQWSDDKNFLVSDFVIQLPQRGTLRGTQRIGWDASIGKFRSWVFDAEGGHAEGLWTHVDGQWIVKVNGTRPDGESGTVTNIYMPAGPDSFFLSSVDRIVGEAAAPDVTVKVVRKPPAPMQR